MKHNANPKKNPKKNKPERKQPAVPDAAAPLLMPGWKCWGAVVYVALALGVDTLAVWGVQWPFDWSILSWNPHRILRWALQCGIPERMVSFITAWPMGQVDYFKLVFWFLIPFLFCLRRMDWGAMRAGRWRRNDLYLLGGLAVFGLVAIFIIPLFPSLREYYPSLRSSRAVQWEQFPVRMLWVFSWLLGWEFMHRYVLLRQVTARWPRYGWCIVPLFESAYHLQKAWMEVAAMLVFSIVLTRWSLRRNNVLLPFLAHLIVEIELILFLMLL